MGTDFTPEPGTVYLRCRDRDSGRRPSHWTSVHIGGADGDRCRSAGRIDHYDLHVGIIGAVGSAETKDNITTAVGHPDCSRPHHQSAPTGKRARLVGAENDRYRPWPRPVLTVQSRKLLAHPRTDSDEPPPVQVSRLYLRPVTCSPSDVMQCDARCLL
jgi:hypothetical protein